ncbi:hypothetical protein AM588_10002043 [Phytophthora nicotianae]|uniref:Uncharacterized protein n=1 Tax=Phytophthora nicotianae TaxID=4792 RepID=A0A0W8CY72_PHYNI|nr:hypothetical protein AM588_10002043 [Phytophthora nicotianae]
MASSAPTSTGLESPEALARLNAAIMGERNPRGIPSAVFVGQIEEDLSFLRDQIITTEVNIARIFNHDVRRRRQEKDDKLVAELEAK